MTVAIDPNHPVLNNDLDRDNPDTFGSLAKRDASFTTQAGSTSNGSTTESGEFNTSTQASLRPSQTEDLPSENVFGEQGRPSYGARDASDESMASASYGNIMTTDEFDNMRESETTLAHRAGTPSLANNQPELISEATTRSDDHRAELGDENPSNSLNSLKSTVKEGMSAIGSFLSNASKSIRGAEAFSGGNHAAPRTAMSSDENATGTKDEHYDLISLLYHSLKAADRCELFSADARKNGDQELASFFTRIREEEISRSERLKQLLVQRLDVEHMDRTSQAVSSSQSSSLDRTA